MKSKIITLIFIVKYSLAQVGIGTTSPQSILDISSNNDGILIPRVNILDFTTAAPLVAPQESELVYNDSPTTINGFYFWSGTEWKTIDSNSWSLRGNDLDSSFIENTGVAQTDQDGTFYDEDFDDTDPLWTMNAAIETNYIGTSNTSDPLILTQGEDPVVTLHERQILAMRRGTPDKPTYSFYDSPQTGMSSTTSWNNSNLGKWRSILAGNSNTPSTNLNFTTLELSVDGTDIFRLTGEGAPIGQTAFVYGDLFVNEDGTKSGDFSADGNILSRNNIIVDSNSGSDGHIVVRRNDASSATLAIIRGGTGNIQTFDGTGTSAADRTFQVNALDGNVTTQGSITSDSNISGRITTTIGNANPNGIRGLRGELYVVVGAGAADGLYYNSTGRTTWIKI
jgi:hypothetical protein